MVPFGGTSAVCSTQVRVSTPVGWVAVQGTAVVVVNLFKYRSRLLLKTTSLVNACVELCQFKPLQSQKLKLLDLLHCGG